MPECVEEDQMRVFPWVVIIGLVIIHFFMVSLNREMLKTNAEMNRLNHEVIMQLHDSIEQNKTIVKMMDGCTWTRTK